tara:strand:- start:3505 stop:4185 length:681 start_codon:yes stop_codon:yes gene_type:complete
VDTRTEEQKKRAHSLESELSALTLACMVVDLEGRVVVDPLTGILSRRSLMECASVLFARSLKCDADDRRKKNTQSLSVLFIDIDHLKLVNNGHGRAAGDTVLQGVARALKQGIRKDDIVARYGGEEFAILMPDTKEAVAVERAKDLLGQIRGLSLFPGQLNLSVTASIGVATSEQFSSFGELCDAADGALYYAKNHGRDQVACRGITRERRRWIATDVRHREERRK